MRRRAAILVLVVIALVVPAIPASAVNEYLCEGVPSAAFVDVPDSSQFKPFIDCLVFFGVTTGTGPGTFGPAASVERWQMALFLQRVWTLALGWAPLSGALQGYTDIGSLTNEAQVAINQTAQMVVTTGVGAGLYGPFDPVPRWQMAIFLARFATAAGTSLPAPTPTGFTDIASLSVEAQDAIATVKSLGITTGTSATTFSPDDIVTREQMSAFLIRTVQATWFIAAGDFVDSCSTDAQGIETCVGSGEWFGGVPLRFLHGWYAELPGDTSGIDDPATFVDFYLDGVLQTSVEISLTVRSASAPEHPGVTFRRWEVQTPSGLTGSHTLQALFYAEGLVVGAHTATVNFG